MHPCGRAKTVLIKLAKLIQRNAARAGRAGEPRQRQNRSSTARRSTCPRRCTTIKWHAEAVDKIYDQTAPCGVTTRIAVIVREPIGVVGARCCRGTSRLLMLAWKIGPALAAGCSVIVKPAEQTITDRAARGRTGVRRQACQRGVSAGICRGDGPNRGRAAGSAPGCGHGQLHGIDRNRASGSCAMRQIRNLKKVVLECGGKNPAVVLGRCREPRLWWRSHVVNAAAFWNMGENCSATSRLIVHIRT